MKISSRAISDHMGALITVGHDLLAILSVLWKSADIRHKANSFAIDRYRQVSSLKSENPILDISCNDPVPIIECTGPEVSIMLGTDQVSS